MWDRRPIHSIPSPTLSCPPLWQQITAIMFRILKAIEFITLQYYSLKTWLSEFKSEFKFKYDISSTISKKDFFILSMLTNNQTTKN